MQATGDEGKDFCVVNARELGFLQKSNIYGERRRVTQPKHPRTSLDRQDHARSKSTQRGFYPLSTERSSYKVGVLLQGVTTTRTQVANLQLT